MVTIEELQKSIAEEKKKVKKAQEQQALEIKKSDLQKELFQLKGRKIISVGKSTSRILKRTGRGLTKIIKKVAPVIKKQAILIRQQQLRDEAIERKLAKKKPIKKKKTPTKKAQGLTIFNELDF